MSGVDDLTRAIDALVTARVQQALANRRKTHLDRPAIDKIARENVEAALLGLREALEKSVIVD